ncbi:MAG: tRNA dihydrouridine synthase DusB [Clostridia bacterium]|nr:tRNA dihydrouridine synthase DusB [Clostridia bacterium]MDD4571310.1 tRNA dihydrouridine synthase DusB [Clostridia bacterium]
MKIGNLQLKNKIITAPMAGYTDRPYRDILHDMGAALVYTEMISDKALIYKNSNTLEMLDFVDEEKPIGVQLFGSEPETMAKAAKMLAEYPVSVIDINMGCPVPKVVRNHEGAALMQDIALACKIVAAVAEAVKLPITVKMRLGWDENSLNAPELAQAVAKAGAQAITVHGRTRNQFYRGTADWQAIAEVVKAVPIPVIANGDIFSIETVQSCYEATGCAAFMIGRGMLGNPWLIRDLVRSEAGLPALPAPDLAEKLDMAIKHLQSQILKMGEERGIKQMRAHLPHYLKGLKGGASLRNSLNQLSGLDEVIVALRDYGLKSRTVL